MRSPMLDCSSWVAFTILLTPSGAIESPAVRTFCIVVGFVAVIGLVLHSRTLERALA